MLGCCKGGKHNHFGIAGKQDCFYDLVKKIIQNDEKTQVSWVEDKDSTNSVEDVLLLHLRNFNAT